MSEEGSDDFRSYALSGIKNEKRPRKKRRVRKKNSIPEEDSFAIEKIDGQEERFDL